MQQKKLAIQNDGECVIKIWIPLSYLGDKGEEIVKMIDTETMHDT